MAKKSFVDDPRFHQWDGVPRRLPLKFHERAVIPCVLTRGDIGPWEYILEGGERVRFEYRCTIRNVCERDEAYWNNECQNLYKLSFAQIQDVWRRRMGKIDEWWNLVHMIKIE